LPAISHPPTAACTLTVRFDVTPDAFPSFLAKVCEIAAQSVELELGCLRFDVLVPADGMGSSVLLYEIYRTRDDFDLHLESPHYLSFDAATKHMVLAKQVVFHQLYEHAKAERLP
jgi:(4S)-4-hydroxy-5-phosphonooxypentane-2,3-dione isomerase